MKQAFTLAEIFHPIKRSTKTAFTLAEVLITLGIIGVVAALTIPSLIQNYQKQTTVTRLKKAYAEISQTLKMAETEYDSMDNWNYVSLPESQGFQEFYWVENYFLPYIKTVKVCLGKENLSKCGTDGKVRNLNGNVFQTPFENSTYVITASGYGIQLNAGGKNNKNESIYSPHMHFYVDIDGPNRSKNLLGKDVFLMTANFGKQVGIESDSPIAESNEKKSGLAMFGNGWNPALTREDLKSHNGFGCSKDATTQAGRFCGAMIQNDGWQIAPDYPW